MYIVKSVKWLIPFLGIVLFSGCSSAINFSAKVDSDTQQEPESKKIAIFFDGTANDPNSDTNIKQLHSLISLQKRDDIATSYIKGVGTSGKVLGMAVGWGIGYDVREAYQFLLKNYNPKDEIYIFGFSRGAYASRILSALLYYGGIPKIKPLLNDKGEDIFDYKDLSEEIYSAYKGDKSLKERRLEILSVLRSIENHEIKIITPVNVKFLGIWDTVEALGIPNYEEDIDVPNNRYGDQLCNVEKAYHAVSIDDNRANVFTPILITRKHLYNNCKGWDEVKKKEHQKANVREVYFAGAHSDVGGGYENNYLNGVSLNWMISHLDDFNILPKDSSVQQNMFAKSHDPESGIIWGLLYHKKNRTLHNYINENEADEHPSYEKKLKIHDSVFKRLEKKKAQKHEYKWLDSFKECFEEVGENKEYLKYKGDDNCSKLVTIKNKDNEK